MVDERLTIDQAAARLGISARTVRRRIRAGVLRSEKQETPQGFVYHVLLTAEEVTVTATEEPVSALEPEQGTTGEGAALAAAEATIAELRAHLTTVEAERDWLRDLADKQQATIEHLTLDLGQLRRSELAAPFQPVLGQARNVDSHEVSPPASRDQAPSTSEATRPPAYPPSDHEADPSTQPDSQPPTPEKTPAVARRARWWRFWKRGT